jgi:hypothetical protein
MNSVYSQTGIKKFIPWTILLILILLFDIVKVLPQTKEWLSIKKEINTISRTIEEGKTQQELSKKTLDTLKMKFENEAEEYIIEESQIFPEHFDAYEVSKILEIFSIQHSLLRVDSGLRLERISFSGGGKVKPGDAFLQSKVSLEFLCTEETLKRVIKYLQSGELPDDYNDNPSLDARDIDYLRSHRLPLAHIESIRINQASSENSFKKVSLDVSFFSQQ